MERSESQQLAGRDAISTTAISVKRSDCAFNDAYNLTPQSTAEAKIVRADNCAQAISKSLPAGLPVCEWECSSPTSKGIVVALHGSMGDTLSFDGIARHLAGSGFEVFAMGERGHDRWVTGPNTTDHDRLFDYKQSSDDLSALLVELKKKYPDKPIFLMGESIGAAVAAKTALNHPELVNGLVLSSCGNKPQHYELKYVLPDLITGIRHPNRQFDVSNYMARASNDPKIVQAMKDDQLAVHSMNGKSALATKMFLDDAGSTYKHLNPNIPLLFLQGGQDRVIKPESAKELFVHAKSHDKQWAELPDSGHIIFQATRIKPEAEKTATDWLTGHADGLQVTQVGYATEK
jgi:alpha-beta hydrolase superfamily lysophospholipase